MLYKAKNEAIKLMALEVKNKAKNEGKGLKILTAKQSLRRLLIVLA